MSSPNEMKELQQGIEHIQQQLQMLLQQGAELEQLIESLKELKKYSDRKEVLIPFGAGLFLKSEIKDPKHVLLNVGAGVTIEKDIDSTIELVEKQYKELGVIEQSMQEELAHVRQQLQFMQLSQVHQKG